MISFISGVLMERWINSIPDPPKKDCWKCEGNGKLTNIGPFGEIDSSFGPIRPCDQCKGTGKL